MADPRFYTPQVLFVVGGKALLTEQARHHAGRVLRMKAGDRAVLFDGKGLEAAGPIHFEGKDAWIDVQSVSCPPVESPVAITLVQALVSPEKMEADGVRPAGSVEQMYSECNFISLHIPATAQTKKSIGYDLITLMPSGGCLLNTARKEIMNEAELDKALTDRPDLKYATDIAADNQAELNEKFGKRVFATPKKMGAETAEANINAGLAAASQIVDFFATGNTKFQVNR